MSANSPPLLPINTHQNINQTLCGTPLELSSNGSRVSMTATPEMVVDDTGLVHGGFIFGLADHAAMIAVNHANVVLGGAGIKFLKPVRSGDDLVANAEIISDQGKRKIVNVEVTRHTEVVFSGEFQCVVLDTHVLSDKE